MINKQLKEIPSISQVLLEIDQSISLHNRYIKEIIEQKDTKVIIFFLLFKSVLKKT